MKINNSMLPVSNLKRPRKLTFDKISFRSRSINRDQESALTALRTTSHDSNRQRWTWCSWQLEKEKALVRSWGANSQGGSRIPSSFTMKKTGSTARSYPKGSIFSSWFLDGTASLARILSTSRYQSPSNLLLPPCSNQRYLNLDWGR